MTYFSFSGLVSLASNLHAKLELCIISHTGDIRGVQNLKSRSRDLGLLTHFSFFALVSLTFNLHAKLEVCIISHSGDIRGRIPVSRDNKSVKDGSDSTVISSRSRSTL